jgi:hypothetical protein
MAFNLKFSLKKFFKGIVSRDYEYVLLIAVCRWDIFILTKDGFNFLKCRFLF